LRTRTEITNILRNDFIDVQGIFQQERAYTGAAKRGHIRANAKAITKVADKTADVRAFGAHYPEAYRRKINFRDFKFLNLNFARL
jgi:hypothetical protein